MFTYFNVCGGPWATEELMSSAGPLFGFIGLIIFPIFWALPIILITAELSSVFPDDGGLLFRKKFIFIILIL